ncbi:hypothetical protein GINT2_002129 [Glugoides intestinalis]
MVVLRKQPVKSSENQTTTNEEKDLIRIFRENYKSILRVLYSEKEYKKHYKPAFDEPHANKDKAYIMFHKSSEYIKDEIALKYMKELLQIVVLRVPTNIDIEIVRLLKNIRELYIDGIKELEKIPDLLFDGLTNLELLSFQNNNIKELQPNIFSNLQKLEYLYLSKNKITELPSCVFDGLVNLKSLWLEDNNIKELQPNIFNNLQKLEYLRLYSNKLTEFPSCVFDGHVNLIKLWLQNNNIKELQPNLFNNLQKLESLNLSDNKLTEFPEGVLSELGSLQELDLSKNEIKSFPIGSFTGLKKLKILFLSNNKLTEIPPSILSLTNLESLDICSNNLTSVPKEIGNMSNLRELRLNSNLITEIPCEIKSLVMTLYILYLKENPLAENGSQGFMGKRELIEHFHDRFVFKTEEKMATYRLLKEELYARLDKEPIHWNRERLKELRLSPVPTRTLSDEDILKIWTTDLRQYCNNTYENETNLIKKIDSYLKVLFTREEIPDGLQREYSIIKDLFEYIFKTLKEMIETDSNGVRSYVTVLAHRMCFCPTGKIEGLEHMYSILSGSVFDNNLIGFIEHQVAAYKDIILTETVAIKNPQNVHIINHWRNKMKEELGLVVEYKEKILPISLDKFGDRDGNMLEAFYKRFSPQFIIDKLKESINEEHKWVIESAGLLIGKEEVFEKCFDFGDDVIEDELTDNLVKNIKAEGVEEILLDLKILKTVNTDNSTQ